MLESRRSSKEETHPYQILAAYTGHIQIPASGMTSRQDKLGSWRIASLKTAAARQMRVKLSL